jgi:hypothetical protein
MIKNKTHLKNRIIKLMRKLTWSWQPIKDAENRAKVAPATHECALCGLYVYSGKSEKNLQKLIEKFPTKKVEMGTNFKDHINPVIRISKTTKTTSLDEVMDNMFCDDSYDIQVLCKSCHDSKTKKENEERRK